MNEIEQQIKPMVLIDGAKVKELREKQGLTQLYMATVVGVTTETISRWENRRYPSIKGDNAEKLAGAFGLSLVGLLSAPVGMDFRVILSGNDKLSNVGFGSCGGVCRF